MGDFVHFALFGTLSTPGFLTVTFAVLAVLGFLSPSNRGALTTVVLVFYVCFAGVAGYVSARVFKMLRGDDYRELVLFTAFALPGYVKNFNVYH